MEGNEVVERIGAIELTGLNEAHEEIADAGTVLGLIEQAIFSVKNGSLEGPFNGVVVEWRVRFAKKERQLVPALLHVTDGFTKTGVRFDLLLVELLLHPFVKAVHQLCAFLFVELETLFGAQLVFSRHGIVFVDGSENRENMKAFIGKAHSDVDKIAAAV